MTSKLNIHIEKTRNYPQIKHIPLSLWVAACNLPIKHVSNEKKLGWLGYIGDEILPSYIGHYFINHYFRIPSLTIQYNRKNRRVFFVAHVSFSVFLPKHPGGGEGRAYCFEFQGIGKDVPRAQRTPSWEIPT